MTQNDICNSEEYEQYERLGDFYLGKNLNQAYLCYENAAFLCNDPEYKEQLHIKIDRLKSGGFLSVRKTTFIILSYNNMYLMQKCLESIRQYCAPESYSVIIVDNASTDGVVEWLEQQPDIMLVLCDVNTGFPTGCNIGIQYANPDDDILLLNNDTRMTHNALFWLRMGLYENSHVGATGCVTNYCAIDQLEDVIFSLPNDYLEYAKTINIPCSNPYEEKNKLWGGGMLIKRHVLEEVGPLDEAFTPGYFEDDDFSMRIHAAGYRLIVCHNSFIYHAGSQSFGKRDDLVEIFVKNRNYMAQKWGYDNPTYSPMSEEENIAIQQIMHDKYDFFRLLEIGAGNGNALSRVHYLYPNAQVLGIEQNPLVVQNAVETVPILCLSWKTDRLPFTDHFFDYIIVHNRGLSVTPPKEEITDYFSKYLKENGKLLFTF